MTTPDPLRAALHHTPLTTDELAEVRTRAGFAVLDVPPDRTFEDWHGQATTDRARLLATLDALRAACADIAADTAPERINNDHTRPIRN